MIHHTLTQDLVRTRTAHRLCITWQWGVVQVKQMVTNFINVDLFQIRLVVPLMQHQYKHPNSIPETGQDLLGTVHTMMVPAVVAAEASIYLE